MALPLVHICVRATLDWQDEAAVEAQLKPEFRPKRALWDRTLSMPYHLFRARLKEIARTNLDRVRDASVTPLDAVPEGALVVPVDDDDWFAPDLIDHLARAYDPAVRAYLWQSRVLQARRPGNPVSRLFLGSLDPLRDRTGFVCASNNYAVVAEGSWRELATSHAVAHDQLAARPADVRRIDETLSLQNRNLSSQTLLGWRGPPIPAWKLKRRCGRHRGFYQRVELPTGLEWAQPYVGEMAKLMGELRVR